MANNSDLGTLGKLIAAIATVTVCYVGYAAIELSNELKPVVTTSIRTTREKIAQLQSGYRVDSDRISSRKLSPEDQISLNWLPQNVSVQHYPTSGTEFTVESDDGEQATAVYENPDQWNRVLGELNSAGFSFDPEDEQFNRWRPDIKFMQSVSPVEFSGGRGDPVIDVQVRRVDPADGVVKWIPDQITLDHRFTLDRLYSDGDVRVLDNEQNRLALGLLHGTDVDALVRNMMFPQFGTVASGAPSPVVITADDVVSKYDGSKIEKGTVANLGAPDPVTGKTVVIPDEDWMRRLVTEGRARYLSADDASDRRLAGILKSMRLSPM